GSIEPAAATTDITDWVPPPENAATQPVPDGEGQPAPQTFDIFNDWISANMDQPDALSNPDGISAGVFISFPISSAVIGESAGTPALPSSLSPPTAAPSSGSTSPASMQPPSSGNVTPQFLPPSSSGGGSSGSGPIHFDGPGGGGAGGSGGGSGMMLAATRTNVE